MAYHPTSGPWELGHPQILISLHKIWLISKVLVNEVPAAVTLYQLVAQPHTIQSGPVTKPAIQLYALLFRVVVRFSSL